MANRIKISGTTANVFQIGLKGPILGSNNVTSGYQLNLPANVGANAQVLTTDGTGNLSWTTPSGGGGNGTPGGSNTQVQFNDDGNFGGNANFTFNKTTSLLTLNGNIANVDSMTFDVAAGIEPTVGQLAWDTSFGTLDLGMAGNVIQHIGQQSFYYIQANSAITKGRVIAFAGVTGGTLLGKHANTSDVGFQSQYVMGVASSDIGSGNVGYVTAFGKIEDLDTSSYTNGAILWLEPNTAGLMTTTAPTAPNPKVIVAACLNASTPPATNGRILVRPTFEPKIDDLENVLLTTPSAGQALVYNSSNLWVNGNVSLIANGNSNVSIPAANGNIQFSANTANSMTITSSNVIIGNGAGGIITAGSLTATGAVSAAGNISANFFIGNGSALTGLSTTSISNGNSNVRVFANANVTISSVGNANVVVVTGTGANVAGTLNVTGVVTLTSNANLRVSGGSNGQVLTTDGSSNLRWANAGNATALVNGNSNVIVLANSNVVVSIAGIANVTTLASSSATFGTTGSGGNITGANIVTANVANVLSVSVTGNIGNANVITANTFTGNTITIDGLSVGTQIIPQNSQSANYDIVAADSGKQLFHPSADTTDRVFTIPANSNVAFSVGTTITFINQASAGNVTIAVTTDTIRLAGNGATGNRTLAANGIATTVKVTNTEWIISGVNLT